MIIDLVEWAQGLLACWVPGVCWSSSERAVVSQLLRDRMWGTNHSKSLRSSQLPLVTVTLQRLQCVIWCSGDWFWVVTVWTGSPSTCCSWPANVDTLWQTMCSFGYSSPQDGEGKRVEGVNGAHVEINNLFSSPCSLSSFELAVFPSVWQQNFVIKSTWEKPVVFFLVKTASMSSEHSIIYWDSKD